VQGNYTIDGGTTWFPFYSPGAFPDPTNQKLPPFPEITNVTAAFDRNHKLYIVNSQHTADSKAGVIAFDGFDFSLGIPLSLGPTKKLYSWANGDAALNPTLAVDTNLASFTDPVTGATQTDPFAGNIYVAWNTENNAPNNPPNSFNPNTIKLIVS